MSSRIEVNRKELNIRVESVEVETINKYNEINVQMELMKTNNVKSNDIEGMPKKIKWN